MKKEKNLFNKDRINYLKDEVSNNWNLLKNGTEKMFKEFFKKETNKKQRANMWTFSRLIIPFITLICSIAGLVTGLVPLFIISGIIAGMGAVTDYFDGKSSRKHKSTSEYGKVLDQVSDKVFAGIIGMNLLFINISYLIILIGEAIISSINIGYKIKHKDLNINSTKIGKIKEWPLFLSLALGFLSSISAGWLIAANVSILVTFITQILTASSYIIQNNNEVKKLKNNESNQLKLLENENNKNEKELQLTKSKDINETIKKNDKSLSKTKQIEELKKFRDEITVEERNLNNQPIQKKLKK